MEEDSLPSPFLFQRFGQMKINSPTHLYKYIEKKFPKIYQHIEVEEDISWNEYRIKIEEDWFSQECHIDYTKDSESNKIIHGIKLNSALKQFQKEYEDTLKQVTEAKFKYQILKTLVSPFIIGEVDDELKFERGYIKSSITLVYKFSKYSVDVYSLLDSDMEDMLIYELGFDKNYGIGIPVYEFVNDTDNSIKKLKRIVSNITKCCLYYFEKKEKINNRWNNMIQKLNDDKENEIKKLSNWKEN